MATLQKIRNRGGVLVSIVIGLALVAFIVGDALSSGPVLSIVPGTKWEKLEVNLSAFRNINKK